jgi:exodeoxyribonuclease VII small subunit
MKKTVSFETACTQLDAILEEMSDDDITLDRSLELYATASELISQSNKIIKNAKLKIEEIDAKTNADLQEEQL